MLKKTTLKYNFFISSVIYIFNPYMFWMVPYAQELGLTYVLGDALY